MPRASKRGRKSAAETRGGGSTGRGRRTRGATMEDILQSSVTFAQGGGHVSAHLSNYPTAEDGDIISRRRTRTSGLESLLTQNSGSYGAQAQISGHMPAHVSGHVPGYTTAESDGNCSTSKRTRAAAMNNMLQSRAAFAAQQSQVNGHVPTHVPGYPTTESSGSCGRGRRSRTSGLENLLSQSSASYATQPQISGHVPAHVAGPPPLPGFPTAEDGSSCGRGRRTRASAMSNLLQSSAAFAAQQSQVSGHVPHMSGHVPGFPTAEQPCEQLAHNMMQTPITAPYPSMQVAAGMAKAQNGRYYTRAQEHERSTPYPIPGQNSSSNQVLYPNMVPRTTATFSVPEQLPQLATVTEHAGVPRYNTRSAVHNLPLATAPTMDRYWANASQPATTRAETSPQMNTQTPTITDPSKKTDDKQIQTEFTLTDDEIIFLQTLREKKIDPVKFTAIISQDENDAPDGSKISDDNRLVPANAINQLLSESERFKVMFAYRCMSQYQKIIAWLLQLVRHYHQVPKASCSVSAQEFEQVANLAASAPFNLQNLQEAVAEQVHNLPESIVEEINLPNDASASNICDGTPIEAPQRNMSPNAQGFPIPTIFGRNHTRFNNFNFMSNNSHHNIQFSPNNGQFYNLQFPFMQNFHFNPNGVMDPRFLQAPQEMDPYGLLWQ